jgi:hypothetical protein
VTADKIEELGARASNGDGNNEIGGHNQLRGVLESATRCNEVLSFLLERKASHLRLLRKSEGREEPDKALGLVFATNNRGRAHRNVDSSTDSSSDSLHILYMVANKAISYSDNAGLYESNNSPETDKLVTSLHRLTSIISRII